jgi:hypothetical protein
MKINDLKEKTHIVNDDIKGRGTFYKEFTVDDDGEDISYVFPDTKEFINILKRKLIQEKFISIEENQENESAKTAKS